MTAEPVIGLPTTCSIEANLLLNGKVVGFARDTFTATSMSPPLKALHLTQPFIVVDFVTFATVDSVATAELTTTALDDFSLVLMKPAGLMPNPSEAMCGTFRGIR